MFNKILQSIAIASLLWGGYALSDTVTATSAAVLPDAEFQQNSSLISKNLAFDGFGITVKAKKHVNLSLLVPKSKYSSSDPDKFLADFEAVRQAKYPNEEIELVIYPKSLPEKSGDNAPTASGVLYMARAYKWNIYLSYGYAYGWYYYGYKGVAATPAFARPPPCRSARQSNTWYVGGAAYYIATGSRSGYVNTYGARGVCLSSSCRFNLVAYFPY